MNAEQREWLDWLASAYRGNDNALKTDVSDASQPWWQETLDRQREEARARRTPEHDRRLKREMRLIALGFSEEERRTIDGYESWLSWCGRAWSDIRRDFQALDPPYVGSDRGRRGPVSAARRRAIYNRQAGRCAYCDLLLLPLASAADPDLRGRPDLPQLDHRQPVSRGGESLDENLCYACVRCNQRKFSRTDEEYRHYPRDPISRLGLSPKTIRWMISVEDRYSWDLHAPLELVHPRGSYDSTRQTSSDC